MKYGSIKAVCLVILACIAIPSIAGQVTVDLHSIILDSFDGTTTHEWFDGRHHRSYEFGWNMVASRFATTITDNDGNETSYPRSRFVDSWPIQLYGHNRDQRPLRSFGINGRFDRQGYNWIDIFPVELDGDTPSDRPFEIPLPGRVRYMDLWVWGANHDYYIEAYIRDYQGIVHMIRLGDIRHPGWKNLRARIPNHIRQDKLVLPAHAQLRFVKFRLWTQPTERVDNFYVYFNRFKINTDTFESLFDGDELADPDLIQQVFWADNGTN